MFNRKIPCSVNKKSSYTLVEDHLPENDNHVLVIYRSRMLWSGSKSYLGTGTFDPRRGWDVLGDVLAWKPMGSEDEEMLEHFRKEDSKE